MYSYLQREPACIADISFIQLKYAMQSLVEEDDDNVPEA